MSNDSSDECFMRRNLQSSRIGEEMIIFDDRVGKYYVTGQVGGDVWEMLIEPLPRKSICAGLLDIYLIDEAECNLQVEKFLRQMLETDLIQAIG